MTLQHREGVDESRRGLRTQALGVDRAVGEGEPQVPGDERRLEGLAGLGGSPYYAIAGAGLLCSALLYWRGSPTGIWLFAGIYAGTCIWAVWEAGTEVWPLVPRIVALSVLGVLAAIVAPSLLDGRGRRSSFAVAGALTLTVVAFFWAMATPQGVIVNAPSAAVANASTLPADKSTDWKHYGRTPSGTRFTTAGEITPENVHQL